MSLASYSELKSAVADFLNRQDLTATIPTFIALAEARMLRRLRTRDMRTVNSAFSISAYRNALPTDFLEQIGCRITSVSPSKPLTYRTPEEAAKLLFQYGDVTGQPEWFTIEGGYLGAIRQPSTTFTAELIYYARPAALSDSNASNWLLSKHPDAYLYGTLLHSAPYLKSDERIDVWRSLYSEVIEDILLEDQRSQVGGAAPQSFGRAIG